LSSADKVTSKFTGTATITTSNPGTIATPKLVQDDMNYGVSTKYTITFKAANPMPSGFAIVLTFPSSITLSSAPSAQITY
jgi:hypothetical protein